MSDISKAIGARLKALRRSYNVSQKKLAEELGLTQSAICYYESGKKRISSEFLIMIANFFEVDLNYFNVTDNPGILKSPTLKNKTIKVPIDENFTLHVNIKIKGNK